MRAWRTPILGLGEQGGPMPPKQQHGNGPVACAPRSAAAGGRGAGGAAHGGQAGGWGRGPGGGEGGIVLLRGPRQPLWVCGGCGEDANWACRLRCRGCSRFAPRSVQDAARSADAAWQLQQTDKRATPGEAAKAAARQGPKRQRAQRTPPPPPTLAGATFADVVKRMGLDAGREQRDEAMDQKVEEEVPSTMPEETATKLRYWRERWQAAIKAGEYGKEDLQECDKRIEEVLDAAKAARPWISRIQGATQRQARALAQQEVARADVDAARAALSNLEVVLQAATAEAEEATAALEAIKAEEQPVAQVPNVAAALHALRLAAEQAGLDLASLAAQLVAPPAATQPAQLSPQPLQAHVVPSAQAQQPQVLATPVAHRPASQAESACFIPPGQQTPTANDRSRSPGRGSELDAVSVGSAGRSRSRGGAW